MEKIQFSLPLQKIDSEQRMVYGWASTPQIDSDGEMIPTEALAKSLPNYMKFPTIREMHQAKAVGVTKEAEIKSGKGLWIGAKIVSDEAWKLVKEGVYSAFSIGGNVVRRNKSLIEELDLIEISLVDVPANKGAVIELWKAGKVSKSAETVYSLSNLMIQCKDLMSYYSFLGKSTKDLEKCLEMIKRMIATEALETEKEANEAKESLFASKNPADLEKFINSLERLKFEDNPIAETLRKGVIVSMKKELETKKGEEVAEVEATTEVVEPTEVVESTETEVEVEETTTEVEEPAEAVEESKESGDSPELTKLDGLEDRLEKLEKAEEPSEAEPVEKLDLGPTITKVVGVVEKLLGVIEGLEGRLKSVEAAIGDLPAPTKSKSAFVHKQIAAVVEEKDTELTKQVSTEVEAKKARWEELKKLYNELGRNQFAKQGFSLEASKLQTELEKLNVVIR